MQSPAPTGSGPSSQITLSPVEKSAFAYLFNLADPERLGLVTGDAAVAFFAKSKLPPQTLGPIWAMADSENNGFLTPPGFSKALRLIAHAQRGEPVTEALLTRPGPPPALEGISLPVTSQVTGSSAGAAVNRPGVIEIKPEDRARYTRIFANSGPSGGLIDGDKAKEIFVKSKLPFDKLGAIWNLADTQARGTLDLTDFIIAMHFIQNIMNGTLNSIPAALPPGLYEQAKGSGGGGSRIMPGSPLAAQNTGGSASGFGSMPRQMTGSAFPQTPSQNNPARGSNFASPQPTPAIPMSATPWDVSSEEKGRADQFFDGLDSSKQGRLDGATVVPFFMQSKLSESVLAHIWDLSDVTQSGTLTKDEFAVAMHLINSQIAGKPLPQELPAGLVPPSMRNMNLPKAVDPQQTDTQRDLFSLMDDDAPPPPISAPPSAFITPSSAAPATSVQKTAPGPFDDDFFGGDPTPAAPASFFPPVPKALSPAPTGGSFNSARSPNLAAPGTPTSRLGSAFSPAAGDQGAEYGNKSIQLQSTQKAVTDLEGKRNGLQSSVAANSTDLAELETRLATVRSQHEAESKLVKDLEVRQQTLSGELKTLRENVIREESGLSALRAEKDELEQALMRDREDVRDMKKRMNDVQTETKRLKDELEKLRKDARQQKGLVAISKKQLATSESEQDKVATEIETARHVEPVDESSNPITANGSNPETALSPAASVRSTNPFDRFGSQNSQPGTPGASHHPSTSSALATGAGAGAVLGGAAAAAAHYTGSENDSQTDAFSVAPKSAKESGQMDGQMDDFDDAFAVPGQSATQASSVPATGSDFDDNFGDDFGAAVISPPASQDAKAGSNAPESAFDDAFGSKDEQEDPAPSSQEINSAVEPSAVETSGTSATAAGSDDDISSDEDEEEGPEDVDGYKPPTGRFAESDNDKFSNTEAEAGSRAAARGPGDLDDEAGMQTVPGGLGDVMSEDTALSGTGTEADASSAAPAGDTAAATIGSEADPVASTMSRQMTGATDADDGDFHDAINTSHDNPKDDAGAETHGDTNKAGGGAGMAAAALAAGGGALAMGDGPVEPELTSPVDPEDDIPLSQIAASQNKELDEFTAVHSPRATGLTDGTDPEAGPVRSSSIGRSISPSSSNKTRRAPPPAPMRSGTLNSATSATSTTPNVLPAATPTASGTNPFGMDEFGDAQTNNTKDSHQGGGTFDDFDSAFEDMGQPQPLSASTGADAPPNFSTGNRRDANTSDGFDDAFDNDFDFAPSFGPSSTSGGTASSPAPAALDKSLTAAGGTAPASSQQSSAQTGFGDDNAFYDFDSAFGPSASSTTNSGAGNKAVDTTSQTPSGAGATERGTSSNDTSGFSFEDAFDPSASQSAAGSAVPTSPTAPAGRYAPPPGPPPGFSGAIAPAVPSRRETPAGGDDYTGALPDDAGPVKQLCGMGFTRANVILALEKSNYRTEKALERLLASA